MKFSDFEYKRPDIKVLKKDFKKALKIFEKSSDPMSQNNAMAEINRLRNFFETMQSLAYIRHSLDTSDAFYEKEQQFYDDNEAAYQNLVHRYYQALLKSEHKNTLMKTKGEQIFLLAEKAVASFSPKIEQEITKENRLVTEYNRLMASIEVNYDNKTLNLSQMAPYLIQKDRGMRRHAYKKMYNALLNHGERLDSIYHDLVQVRAKIADKLGHSSFIETGYARMGRTDYNEKDVARFRENILQYIVPLAVELRNSQKTHLNVDRLNFYDEAFRFATGNARPVGGRDVLMNKAVEMYHDLGPDTGAFFDFMISTGLLDLDARAGKSGGGYAAFLSDYKSPFIFANFNGTEHDVEVLTHEAGHALQMYLSRNYDLPEYISPTLEACEVHSMSMELLTWPYMQHFFGDDTVKFKYAHLTGSLLFLPYAALVDHFQHEVYLNPGLSPDERAGVWQRLEAMYLPWRNYDELPFVSQGRLWQRQSHIFSSPFYYIDYALAQIASLQMWAKAEKNRSTTMKDYIELCKAGGSKSFLKMLSLADIPSPFETENWQQIIDQVNSFINSHPLESFT